MKILVTGASGFLGSWICRVLSNNYEVIALLRENSEEYRLIGIQNLTIIHSDDWQQIITETKPDVVIINDWWGVGNQFRNDSRQYENLIRFKSTLDVAIKSGASLVMGLGSQAELGPISGLILETQPENPTTDYGKAKSQAKEILFESTKNTNTRSIWFRVFSTYGALDSGGWLITDTIDSLLADKAIALTAGEQVWSYLHAYDLANSIKFLISNQNLSGIINIGNPNVFTIKSVAQEIGKILGKETLLKFGEVPYRDDQVMELRPACEKLTNAGWKPDVSLSSGLKHTIEWMKGFETDLILSKTDSLKLNLPKRIK